MFRYSFVSFPVSSLTVCRNILSKHLFKKPSRVLFNISKDSILHPYKVLNRFSLYT
jgi:hypothetical protein